MHRSARGAVRREQLCPRGGKLERERQAVEPANESCTAGASSMSGRTACARSRKSETASSSIIGGRSCCSSPAILSGFATGDESRSAGAAASEVGQRARGVREELLEVVEHDMGLLFAHARRDRRGVVARRAEIPRDRREQESRVPDRRQRDEHGAAVGVLCEQACELEREPRLSRPAGADDGEDSRVVREPGRDRVEQLALSAEERRGGRRQRNRSRSAEWWKAVGAELMEMHRPLEVLEAMRPSWIVGSSTNARVVVRQDDLTAMGERRDTGAAMDVDADVSLGGDGRLAGMEAHPDADGPAVERVAARHRRRDGARCSREGDEERVSLGVDLDAVRAPRTPRAGPDGAPSSAAA